MHAFLEVGVLPLPQIKVSGNLNKILTLTPLPLPLPLLPPQSNNVRQTVSMQAKNSHRKALSTITAAGAFILPAAANTAAGKSSRFSVFGLIGDGTSYSEGAAYGSDQSNVRDSWCRQRPCQNTRAEEAGKAVLPGYRGSESSGHPQERRQVRGFAC